MFGRRKPSPVDSPVLVIDALGFAARIRACNRDNLIQLSELLDRQYYRFRAKIPFRLVSIGPRRVFGTGEFTTFRLNDMFVLFSTKTDQEAAHRHLVASLLLFQVLLLEGFIPRGGLGFGLVLRGGESILGPGFMDAYDAAEQRPDALRHICAVHVSEAFMRKLRPSRMSLRLLCLFGDSFFLNPRGLVDPDMGRFENGRILELLRVAGANSDKLTATAQFLENFEDYDAAGRPGSRSWQLVREWLASPPKGSSGS